MAVTELADALIQERTPLLLPPELPLAHLTTARQLRKILEIGQLEPVLCKVFSRNLLYFSYGGIFYRTSKLQSERASELPVGVVFSPELLRSVSQLYPFDSGAMASQLFGRVWTERFSPFERRFCVETSNPVDDVRRLVFHLFKNNRGYLEGRAHRDSQKKQHPFPLLYEFLSADLSALSVDHRQRTIEAIVDAPVTLTRHLLWIGFPRLHTAQVLRRVREWTGIVPQYYDYPYTRNFNPAELAARLEQNAYEQVVERYARFPK